MNKANLERIERQKTAINETLDYIRWATYDEYIIVVGLEDIALLLEEFEVTIRDMLVGDSYQNHILGLIDNIIGKLRFTQLSMVAMRTEENKPQIKEDIDGRINAFISVLNVLKFDYPLLKKIGFGKRSTVILGANGAGKSSLSVKLKQHLGQSGVMISAQRILLIPNIDSISNPQQTLAQLRQSQIRDKTNKDQSEYGKLHEDFGVAVRNLIAENIAAGNSYRNEARSYSQSGQVIPEPPKTRLDRTMEIWNSLITHRVLSCPDSMNLVLTEGSNVPYHSSKMSDGEKVLLFLVAQVLQAPIDGFIIVDEPEMYLHKSILRKAWDVLESERQDCVFIYLTHDLEFAASRNDAGKIWIKSFSHPSNWDMQEIPQNEIPEAVVFELIGSRKDILFCEGDRGSLDFKIYSILFSDFTIIPVSSCFDVINYTKAFNQQRLTGTRAIGIIDSDHHPEERLQELEPENIFHLGVAEIENLLLDEFFITKLAEKVLSDQSKIPAIKNSIIDEFERSIESQAAGYVSARIDYHYKDSNVKRGRTKSLIHANLAEFNATIDVETWFSERVLFLQEIASRKNYDAIIRNVNHKGLKAKIQQGLEIGDYETRCIKNLLDPSVAEYLRNQYFNPGLIARTRPRSS